MSQELEALLRDVFAAQGASDAAGLARRAMVDYGMDQRDAKIYELRAFCTEAEISHRFGVSVRHVRRIVHAQMVIHRHSEERDMPMSA
ncbi:MAG TPA: hypothetical protein DCE18_15640 [Syntrophobacteraceae bacterium]|jgi:hypothetical protein|nr:hypothetical protein [Syntrophobacteraceae bacterium]